jgi:hypothetical protein
MTNGKESDYLESWFGREYSWKYVLKINSKEGD